MRFDYIPRFLRIGTSLIKLPDALERVITVAMIKGIFEIISRQNDQEEISYMNSIVSIFVSLIIAAIVIWIVGKLNLGLSVKSFGSAIIAAIVITLVAGIFYWLFDSLGISIGGGVIGAIIQLVVTALVLLISNLFVPGMSVKGFGGAIIAAISIAILNWLANWLLSIIGLV